jgi:hypothetical protein
MVSVVTLIKVVTSRVASVKCVIANWDPNRQTCVTANISCYTVLI